MKFLCIFAVCLAMAAAAPTDCDTAEALRKSEEGAMQVAEQAAIDANVLADDEARMTEEKAAMESEMASLKSMDEEKADDTEDSEGTAEDNKDSEGTEDTNDSEGTEDTSYLAEDARVMAEDEARLIAEKAAREAENAKMIADENARRLLDIDAIHLEDARVLTIDAAIRADDEARRVADHTVEFRDLALWNGQDQLWRLADNLHSAAAAGRLSAGVLGHGIVAGPAPIAATHVGAPIAAAHFGAPIAAAPVGFAHDGLAYARGGFAAAPAPISAFAQTPVSVAAAPAPIYAAPAAHVAFAPETTVLRHSAVVAQPAVHQSVIPHAIGQPLAFAQPDLAVRSLAPVTTVAGAGHWPHISGARFLGQPC